jgi:hypothetical protein
MPRGPKAEKAPADMTLVELHRPSLGLYCYLFAYTVPSNW